MMDAITGSPYSVGPGTEEAARPGILKIDDWRKILLMIESGPSRIVNRKSSIQKGV
jgi:hypothetical protein